MMLVKYLGDSKMFEYDQHYRKCQQSNKPFIKARIDPKHGKYFVQIDLMTCNYNLSKMEQKEISDLTNKEIEYLKIYCNSKLDGFSIDPELAWFDGVSHTNLDEFCSSLYDITQKYH